MAGAETVIRVRLGAVLLGCTLGAWLLWWQASAVPTANGFAFQQFDGSACEGERAVRGSVREPYMLADASAAPRCTRYEGFVAVDRLRYSEIELDLRGQARLWVDGRKLLDVQRDDVDTSKRAAVRLAPGVHALRLEHGHPGGVGYLRVREHDTRNSHYKYILAPLETTRYFTSEAAAQAALSRGLPGKSSWRAPLWFALALGAMWGGLRLLGVLRGWPTWLPARDLATGAALTALGFMLRASQLGRQDCTWDELSYSVSGQHLVRNWQLGDFAQRAFRWNYPHPPLAKWIYGAAWELGGHEGGRLVSALLGGLGIGLLYAIGVRLFGRSVGMLAAITAAVSPHLVAHARLTGLETPLVCFWNAALLAALVWVGPLGKDGHSREPDAATGTALPAFFASLWAVMAIASRMTAVWIVPLLFGLLVVGSRRRGARLLRVPGAAWLGLAVALGLLLLGWTFLWDDPAAAWARILTRWKGQRTTEFFLGRDMRPPPASYYAAAFAATTPLMTLVLGAAGCVLGWRRAEWRPAIALCVAWLVLPFAQSVSSFRQDLARYVIQSWPALALLAAFAAVELGRALSRRAQVRAGARTTRALALLPALLLVGDAALGLAQVEPYPLDYFNPALGGPSGVARRRTFELGYWGEGQRAAIEWLNVEAPKASRVALQLTPDDTAPRLRDDIVAVNERRADFVVQGHYKFRARPPAGCARVHRVQVAGAPLVDVYDCRVQLVRE